MSFREYDKKTFLVDAANDFTAKRISKRSFLKKSALAGVGFSAFNLGLLGNLRKDRSSLIGTPAFAEDMGDPANRCSRQAEGRIHSAHWH
jgi:multiple sugar transport system substrate-binding protein